METKIEEKITASELEELGFSAASKALDKAERLKKKLTFAFEHFRHVSKEKMDAFQADLQKRTFKREGYTQTWDEVAIVPIKDYKKIPPKECLDALKAAQSMEVDGEKIFDSYGVAIVVEVKKEIPRPDPIIFGYINGFSGHFFITQWDNDITIEQLLKPTEG